VGDRLQVMRILLEGTKFHGVSLFQNEGANTLIIVCPSPSV
jgi:hypothetical protein